MASSSRTPARGAKAPNAAKSAMSKFQNMDAAANPAGAAKPQAAAAGAGAAGNPKNPATIKQMLLEWCKSKVKDYENVNVENFSTSWADGVAFCALIHHFYPESFDFKTVDPKNRAENFKLAFDTAERVAGIAQLLDVEDMVRMKTPDWKCVFTYVQQYYRKFHALETKNRHSVAIVDPPIEHDNPFRDVEKAQEI